MKTLIREVALIKGKCAYVAALVLATLAVAFVIWVRPSQPPLQTQSVTKVDQLVATGSVTVTGVAQQTKDIEIAKTAATAWMLTTRDQPNTYPAGAIRSSQVDTVMALDLVPNGAPTVQQGGYTWLDACDADIWANSALPTHCSRVGIDSEASFGSVSFNGAVARNIRLHIDNTTKLDVSTTVANLFTSLNVTPTTGNAIVAAQLDQNTGTWMQVTNTSAGAAAYSKLEASNDGGSGVADLFAFGTGWTTNGGLKQDSAVLYAGTDMSNGLSVISGAGDVRFYTGGLADANNYWTINTSGYFVSKAGPLIASGSGTPEGAITAPVGSQYMRSDGGAGTSFYAKESGAGNTGWTAMGTGTYIGRQVLTSASGTYTPTSGTNSVVLRMVGSGGGGGGGGGGANLAFGGGGSSGYWLEKRIAPGVAITGGAFVVGAAGTGGSTSGGNGGAGNSTTIVIQGVTYTATGGLGGTGQTTGSTTANANGGGLNTSGASTGDFQGQQGGIPGFRQNGSQGQAGAGGQTPFGGSVMSLTTAADCPPVVGYGAGGGGAAAAATGRNGAAGGAGAIFVEEYR